MIEIIDLRNTNPEDYYKMITPEGQESFETLEGIVLGISEDGVPSGAVAAEPDEDGSVKITSLYVDPDHRRKGIGTELIYGVAGYIDYISGINRIETKFAENAVEGSDLKGFFEALDFDFELDEEHGSFSIRLGDAATEVIERGSSENVLPYNKVTSVVKNTLMAERPFVRSAVAAGILDADMSCFLEDEMIDDPLQGCAIIAKTDDELVLIWAQAEGNKMDLIKLLKHVVETGIKKYGPDQVIRIPYINDNSKKIIQKLVGDKLVVSETVWNAIYDLDGEMEDLSPEEKEMFSLPKE